MAYALIYPDPEKSAEGKSVPSAKLLAARAVLPHSCALADSRLAYEFWILPTALPGLDGLVSVTRHPPPLRAV